MCHPVSDNFDKGLTAGRGASRTPRIGAPGLGGGDASHSAASYWGTLGRCVRRRVARSAECGDFGWIEPASTEFQPTSIVPRGWVSAGPTGQDVQLATRPEAEGCGIRSHLWRAIRLSFAAVAAVNSLAPGAAPGDRRERRRAASTPRRSLAPQRLDSQESRSWESRKSRRARLPCAAAPAHAIAGASRSGFPPGS